MTETITHIENKKHLVPKLRFKGFDDDWNIAELKDFASINPKSTELPNSFIYIDLESVTNGVLLKEERIFKDNSPSRAQRLLEKNDILYQTVRPYQKNNLYFDKTGEYVASTGYAQIRTKNDSKFLFHFLHTEKLVQNVMLRCTGTSYPSINSSDLSKIKMSFPSLPEQTKIASFLSAVDNKLHALKQKHALLELYKKGVMQQLFSGKLRFKDDNGNDYPDWEEKKLGEVCDIKRGASPRPITDKKWFDNNSNIGWVRISDVSRSNKYLEKTEQYFSASAVAKSRFVKKGNMIMSICATLGKPIYTSIDVCIPDSFVVFEKLTLEKEFLFYYLDYIQLNWYKYGQPGTQVNLNSEIVSNETILVPCNLEQTKIASFLSTLDEKINQCQAQIEKMEVWKKGLLQKMFV